MSCKNLHSVSITSVCPVMSDLFPYQLPPHSLHPTYTDLLSVAKTQQHPLPWDFVLTLLST